MTIFHPLVRCRLSPPGVAIAIFTGWYILVTGLVQAASSPGYAWGARIAITLYVAHLVLNVVEFLFVGLR